MKNKFDLQNTLRAIEAYQDKVFFDTKDIVCKDFFNIIDGSVTCGRCDKKMSTFRALFHWHLFK